jgi:hypothetical protein
MRAVCSGVTRLLAIVASWLCSGGVRIGSGPVASLVTSLRLSRCYRYLLLVLEIVLEPILVSTHQEVVELIEERFSRFWLDQL